MSTQSDQTTAQSKDRLQITINSPQDTLWLGTAESVSSQNSQGKFDILPQHANFLTILENTELTVQIGRGEEKKFKIGRAVLYCNDDKVNIYTEI